MAQYTANNDFVNRRDAESCDCKTLYYLNFGNCNVDLPKVLDVESFDGLVGRSELGLVVNSRVFNQSVPQGEFGRLDNFKFYACVDKLFPLAAEKDTTFEAWIAGQQFFDEDEPIPTAFLTNGAVGDIRADPRLASSGYMLTDNNGLFFGHLLTDNAQYAVYGRNDFDRLRQLAATTFLGVGAGFVGNGFSLASILGISLEGLALESFGGNAGLLNGVGNLADLTGFGNDFRILANNTNGWDLEKCKRKRRGRCGQKNECCGVDPRTLLNFVNTASHLNFIRIDTREGSGPLTNFVKSGIRFRLNQDAVDWMINDIIVYTLIGIGEFVDPQYRGVRGPGDAYRVRPCELRFCFGTFTFLDAARPNFNYLDIVDPSTQQAEFGALVQLAEPAQYVVPIAGQDGEVVPVNPAVYFATGGVDDVAFRLFGQGAALVIKDIRMKVCDSAYDEYIYNSISNQCPNIDLIPDCCDTESSSESSSSYTTIEAKVRKCPVKKVKVICHDKKEKKEKKEIKVCDRKEIKVCDKKSKKDRK
jgi:hypothetical protein